MGKEKNPNPNDTLPADPNATQPVRPLTPSDTQRIMVEHTPGPTPSYENFDDVFDAVRRQDEEFRRKVESALQGAMGDQRVRVLDFRWTEGRTFVFTVDVGGHPKQVTVEQYDGAKEK